MCFVLFRKVVLILDSGNKLNHSALNGVFEPKKEKPTYQYLQLLTQRNLIEINRLNEIQGQLYICIIDLSAKYSIACRDEEHLLADEYSDALSNYEKQYSSNAERILQLYIDLTVTGLDYNNDEKEVRYSI